LTFTKGPGNGGTCIAGSARFVCAVNAPHKVLVGLCETLVVRLDCLGRLWTEIRAPRDLFDFLVQLGLRLELLDDIVRMLSHVVLDFPQPVFDLAGSMLLPASRLLAMSIACSPCAASLRALIWFEQWSF